VAPAAPADVREAFRGRLAGFESGHCARARARLPLTRGGLGLLGSVAISLALVLFSMTHPAAARAAEDTTRRLLEALQMQPPEGSGPFPVIMLVPGCSGMSKKEYAAHYREVAERLVGMGYLVVHVDYVASRRLNDACGSFVSPDEIARDIVTVAAHLRSLPLVKPSRIDVIGESLGGGGVLAALGRPGSGAVPPFQRAVVFFPVCRAVPPPRTRAEVLMLFGALDGMTPAESCRQLVQQFATPSDVQIRVYPEAHHGFTLAHLPRKPRPGEPTWAPAYDPAAAKTAWNDALEFLGRPDSRSK